MTCIKTGFHGFDEAYQEYVYGDAFAYDGYSPQSGQEIAIKGIQVQAVHVFRIVQRSFTPLGPKLHFTIHKWGDWFEKGGSTPDSHEGISTMIATHVTNHGYEEKPL